jgi:signal transduction histidine kinase
MTGTEIALAADVAAVGRIDAVPTILEVVCRTTGMGFAAVARVTEDRWIACAVRDEIAFGLIPGSELKVETTICDEIRDSGRAVVIDHVAEDAHYSKHNTPAMYGFQSYISMPIVRANGSFFGTLCSIDPRPAKLNRPEVIGMFKLFADLIAFHLDAQDQITESTQALLDARETAELREQFIAVLGHDLRNPLASVNAGTRMLKKEPLSTKQSTIVALMEQSVIRMAGLIDNVLDFARGRLGGGLILNRVPNADLKPMIEQVTDELRTANPGRAMEVRLALNQPVNCDPVRIGQLLSNLGANALTHGAADAPVIISASTVPGVFELTVSNQGEPIPEEIRTKLFEPFVRMQVRPGTEGLGLGLYIAREIVVAHGGTLDVASSASETRFTVRIPLA